MVIKRVGVSSTVFHFSTNGQHVPRGMVSILKFKDLKMYDGQTTGFLT